MPYFFPKKSLLHIFIDKEINFCFFFCFSQLFWAYTDYSENLDDMSDFVGKRDAEFVFNKKVELLERQMKILVEKKEVKKEKYVEILTELETKHCQGFH